MLKEYLKKVFNSAEAETQGEEVNMTNQIEQAQALADKTAELSTQLETVIATLAEKETVLSELTAKYEAATAALNASAEAQAELQAQAATKRLEARTAAITAAVGTSKVDALLAATNGMEDEQFNTIVSAMAASFDAEAQTPLFNEQGAEVESVVDEKPTHFNQFIKKEGK